jgi:hypothetical protein
MSYPVKLTTNLSNIIAHGLPQDVARAIAMVLFDCYNPLNNAYDKIIDFTIYDEDRYYGIFETVYEYITETSSGWDHAINVGTTMQEIYIRDNNVNVSAIREKLYQGVTMDTIDELFGVPYDRTDPDRIYGIGYDDDSRLHFILDNENIIYILLGFCKQCLSDILDIEYDPKLSRVDLATDIEFLNILLFIAVKLIVMRP